MARTLDYVQRRTDGTVRTVRARVYPADGCRPRRPSKAARVALDTLIALAFAAALMGAAALAELAEVVSR